MFMCLCVCVCVAITFRAKGSYIAADKQYQAALENFLVTI